MADLSTIDAILPRTKRLKAATNDTHERLDQRILATDPFGSRDNYVRFLTVQYRFHRSVDPLYRDAALGALLPDLAERNRFDKLTADLADLGQPSPVDDMPQPFETGAVDLPTALGWLYVAEGSNLGAAILFKLARALDLDEDFGARHLAGHPDGRAQHWRAFTAVLDTIELDDAEEARLEAGAKAAFARVHALVDMAARNGP
jgi:heme oxygenase (biliverdin-IX-beta and delta-forming)